ncbi:MAG: hypothetical protein Q4B43_05580 [Bacteroidota bacterium]|nr:hypothetical protein [Bacteroidota bacterium]
MREYIKGEVAKSIDRAEKVKWSSSLSKTRGTLPGRKNLHKLIRIVFKEPGMVVEIHHKDGGKSILQNDKIF